MPMFRLRQVSLHNPKFITNSQLCDQTRASEGQLCPRVIARSCSGSRQQRHLVSRDTHTHKKRNDLLFSGTLQEDTISISSAMTRATIHAVNVRGCVSSSASLFNHAAVVLVTLNNVSRYDPRTNTPICFVTTARMVIADTKNIYYAGDVPLHTALTRALLT